LAGFGSDLAAGTELRKCSALAVVTFILQLVGLQIVSGDDTKTVPSDRQPTAAVDAQCCYIADNQFVKSIITVNATLIQDLPKS
jgi:hypothetical protein